MLPMIPDGLAATVAAAAEDDQRAWDALVVRFTPMLRRVARSYRLSAQDADDVVQQCWIALLPHIGSIREPEAIGAWLVTTVRRRAVRARQRSLRELPSDLPLVEQVEAPDCLETLVVERERNDALRAAIGRLPGRQRVVLEAMVDTPEHGYRQLSERHHLPIGSIGPTRERGLRRLREDDHLARIIGER